MAFFFLLLFTFIIFFQPAFVFPALEPIQPYRYSALAALFMYVILGKKNTKPILASKYTQFFFLFVIWQILSSSFIWLRAGMDTLLLWLNFIIIFFLIVKQCTEVKYIRILISTIIISIIYLAYYSIENYVPGFRAEGFGWYENANDLVLIQVTIIPLVFYLIETSKHKFWRYGYLFLVGLFATSIVLCGSRQGLLGLSVVLVISLLSMQRIPKYLRTMLTVIMLFVVLTFGVSIVLQRADLGGGMIGDDSSEHRIDQWKACARMLKDHPILGIGPGESTSAMRDYGGIRGLPPHNTLIQVFAEAGIPGGIFFTLFSCYPIWQAWKYIRRRKFLGDSEYLENMECIVTYRFLIIALIGFWTCAFFSNRVHFSILYVLVALIVAVQQNIFVAEGQQGNDNLKSMQSLEARI